MRRLSKALSALMLSLLIQAAPSLADDEPYCNYPNFDPGERSWQTINLYDLDIPDLLPNVDHDINLYVEQWLWDDYHEPGQIVDDYHLEQFIRGIWRSHADNDIRTIWNYFAAHSPAVTPDLPEYGAFGTQDYNFKYPDLSWLSHRNETEVNVHIRAAVYGGGSCSANNISIDIAAHHDSVEDVPDWWYEGEWAGRVFAHEFQHTLESCFDQSEDFEEGFCEGAVAVAGYSKILVGCPHDDNPYSAYDLVYNNGLSQGGLNYAWQSEGTAGWSWKYTGGFLWSAFIFDQFPGLDLDDIEDDLLYKTLRTTESGQMVEGIRSFALAAGNHSAWGYENDPALFREIFHKWTLANLLDGTAVEPTLEYPNHTVRIRQDTDAGIGWLRDNEDNYCNNHPWPVDPDPDYLGCGHWYPPLKSIANLTTSQKPLFAAAIRNF